MLRAVEGLAMKQGRQALRLDCAADNVFLNRYYESMGFMPAGYCEEGAYRGIRREKKIIKNKALEKSGAFGFMGKGDVRGAAPKTPAGT